MENKLKHFVKYFLSLYVSIWIFPIKIFFEVHFLTFGILVVLTTDVLKTVNGRIKKEDRSDEKEKQSDTFLSTISTDIFQTFGILMTSVIKMLERVNRRIRMETRLNRKEKNSDSFLSTIFPDGNGVIKSRRGTDITPIKMKTLSTTISCTSQKQGIGIEKLLGFNSNVVEYSSMKRRRIYSPQISHPPPKNLFIVHEDGVSVINVSNFIVEDPMIHFSKWSHQDANTFFDPYLVL